MHSDLLVIFDCKILESVDLIFIADIHKTRKTYQERRKSGQSNQVPKTHFFIRYFFSNVECDEI